MYCLNCGTRAKPQDQFCESCGNPLLPVRTTGTEQVQATRRPAPPLEQQEPSVEKTAPPSSMPVQTTDRAISSAKEVPSKPKKHKPRRVLRRIVWTTLCIVLSVAVFAGGFVFGLRPDIWRTSFGDKLMNAVSEVFSQGEDDAYPPPYDEESSVANGDIAANIANPGAPTFIHMEGRFSDSKINNQHDAVEALLDVAEDLGISNPQEELDLHSENTLDGYNYYRFAQTYKGIPVHGRGIVVAADDAQYADGLMSNLAPTEDIDTVPKIDEQSVANAAIEYANAIDAGAEAVEAYPGQLCFTADTSLRLAYKIPVVGIAANGMWMNITVFVDASTGVAYAHESNVSALQEEMKVPGQNGDQWIVAEREGNTVSMVSKKLVDEIGTELRVYVPNADISRDDPEATREEYVNFYRPEHRRIVQWNDDDDINRSAVDAMANSIYALEYFHRVFGRKSLDGNGGDIDVYVGIKAIEKEENGAIILKWYTDNAFYSPSPLGGDLVAFSVTGKTQYERSANLDAVAHELTHGIMRHSAVLAGGLQAATLSEAYADIFGECVEDALPGVEADWITGWRDDPVRNHVKPSLRHMDNFVENSKEHDNVTIVTHAAYLMNNGGPTGTEWTPISNMETIANLWYGSLLMLPSNATFSQCRSAVEMSARRLFSQGIISRAQRDGVSNAFDAVGIVAVPTVAGGIVKNDFAMNIHCIKGQSGDPDISVEATIKRVTISLENLSALETAQTWLDDTSNEVWSKQIMVPAEAGLASESAHLDDGIYMLTLSGGAGKTKPVRQLFRVVGQDESAKEAMDIYTDFLASDALERLGQMNRVLQAVLDVEEDWEEMLYMTFMDFDLDGVCEFVAHMPGGSAGYANVSIYKYDRSEMVDGGGYSSNYYPMLMRNLRDGSTFWLLETHERHGVNGYSIGVDRIVQKDGRWGDSNRLWGENLPLFFENVERTIIGDNEREIKTYFLDHYETSTSNFNAAVEQFKSENDLVYTAKKVIARDEWETAQTRDEKLELLRASYVAFEYDLDRVEEKPELIVAVEAIDLNAYAAFIQALDEFEKTDSSETTLSIENTLRQGADSISMYINSHTFFQSTYTGDFVNKTEIEVSGLNAMAASWYYYNGYYYYDVAKPVTGKAKVLADASIAQSRTGYGDILRWKDTDIVYSMTEKQYDGYTQIIIDIDAAAYQERAAALLPTMPGISISDMADFAEFSSGSGDFRIIIRLTDKGNLDHIEIRQLTKGTFEGYEIESEMVASCQIESINETVVTLPDDLDTYQELTSAQ